MRFKRRSPVPFSGSIAATRVVEVVAGVVVKLVRLRVAGALGKDGGLWSARTWLGPIDRETMVSALSCILKVNSLSVDVKYHLSPHVYPCCYSVAFLPCSVKVMLRGKHFPSVQLKFSKPSSQSPI